MSPFAGIRGRVRPYSLMLLGVLAGILIGPAFQPAPTTAATTYTRNWSCQGLDFMPVDDASSFHWSAPALRWGTGNQQCAADIPDKAVVTRVRFTLLDSAPGPFTYVSNCYLGRAGLELSTAGSADTLALVGSSSDIGKQRLVTSSISFATIDRSKYAYFLRCGLAGDTPNVGIYGADITYKITAANG